MDIFIDESRYSRDVLLIKLGYNGSFYGNNKLDWELSQEFSRLMNKNTTITSLRFGNPHKTYIPNISVFMGLMYNTTLTHLDIKVNEDFYIPPNVKYAKISRYPLDGRNTCIHSQYSTSLVELHIKGNFVQISKLLAFLSKCPLTKLSLIDISVNERVSPLRNITTLKELTLLPLTYKTGHADSSMGLVFELPINTITTYHYILDDSFTYPAYKAISEKIRQLYIHIYYFSLRYDWTSQLTKHDLYILNIHYNKFIRNNPKLIKLDIFQNEKPIHLLFVKDAIAHNRNNDPECVWSDIVDIYALFVHIFPPYIMIEILDYLYTDTRVGHRKKIQLLQSIYNFKLSRIL